MLILIVSGTTTIIAHVIMYNTFDNGYRPHIVFPYPATSVVAHLPEGPIGERGGRESSRGVLALD